MLLSIIGLSLLLRRTNLAARLLGLGICIAVTWVAIEYYTGGDRIIGNLVVVILGLLMIITSIWLPLTRRRRLFHFAVGGAAVVAAIIIAVGFNNPVSLAAETVVELLSGIREQIDTVAR